jgi:hypothetical protein
MASGGCRHIEAIGNGTALTMGVAGYATLRKQPPAQQAQRMGN